MDYNVTLNIIEKGLATAVKGTNDLNKNVQSLDKGSTKASKSMSGFGDTLNKALSGNVDPSKLLSSSIGKLGSGIKGMLGPIGLASTAIVALGTGFIKGSEALTKMGGAINTQNESIRKMEFALSKNKNMTAESGKEFSSWASEVQNASAYGDEYVMGLVAMGAQSGATADEIKSSVTLALDIAAQSGQNAEKVMRDLTNAQSDIAKGFAVAAKAGVAFTAEEKKMMTELQNSGNAIEANAMLMERLNETFAGAAAKEVETFAGKQKQLANIMGDVKEEQERIAQAFAEPFLDIATDAWNGLMGIMQNPAVINAVQSIITAFKVMGKVLGEVVSFAVERMKMLFNIVTLIPRAVLEAVTAFYEWATSFEPVQEAIGNIKEGITVLTGAITHLIEGLKFTGEAFNNLLTFNFDGMKESADKAKEAFTNIVDVEANKKKGEEVKQSLIDMHNQTKAHWDREPLEVTASVDDVTDGFSKIESTATKVAKTVEDKFKAASSSIGSMMSDASSIMESVFDSSATKINNSIAATTASIDKMMSQLQADYDAALAAMNESHTAYTMSVDETNMTAEDKANMDYENKMAQLESLQLKSINSNELMAANAIETEKQRLKEEKDMLIKQAQFEAQEAEKLAVLEEQQAAEKLALETKLANDMAMLEWKKEHAAWEGNVKLAEQEKTMAIANGVVGVGQATMQGAVSFARSTAELGPIAGPIVGAGIVSGIIASAMSAKSGIDSASANLDAVKGSAPEMPSFQFGSAGHNLKPGDQALVGEAGPEIVSNVGGQMQVQSTANTASNETGSSSGIIVENINISMERMDGAEFESMIMSIINNMKPNQVSYSV